MHRCSYKFLFVGVILLFIIKLKLCLTQTTLSGDLIFQDDVDLVEGAECMTNSSLAGICTRASKCPRIKLKISMSKICSFAGNEAIVCCVRTSHLVCYGYEIVGKTLLQVRPIVGGTRVRPHEEDHMVAIGWTNDAKISWNCGGSLISSDFVVTAAHCSTNGQVAPDVVRLGVVDLIKWKGNIESPIDLKIPEIIVHPEYKPPSTYNDIALFRVIPTKDDFLIPICLWPLKAIPTDNLTAMGYGTISFGGPQSNVLLMATINYVPQDECVLIFNGKRNDMLFDGIIESQLCAKDQDGQRDTCQGDSGGPLQFTSSIDWEWEKYLVGVTSFGEACLGPSPGVYTRIHSYLDWIEGIVWPDFKN